MQLREAGSEADKVCIIGAGSSGLAAAKTFAERGIPFDCLERENDIGGLWNETTETGVVYDTTYLVSSRRLHRLRGLPDVRGLSDLPLTPGGDGLPPRLCPNLRHSRPPIEARIKAHRPVTAVAPEKHIAPPRKAATAAPPRTPSPVRPRSGPAPHHGTAEQNELKRLFPSTAWPE
jgi:phytoene dehydrogenase-like protein